MHPEDAAIGAHDTMVEILEVEPLHGPLEVRLDAFEVVRMDQAHGQLRRGRDLVGVDAIEPVHLVGPFDGARLQVEIQEAHLRHAPGPQQPLLLFLQRRLYPFHLADVAGDDGEELRLPRVGTVHQKHRGSGDLAAVTRQPRDLARPDAITDGGGKRFRRHELGNRGRMAVGDGER